MPQSPSCAPFFVSPFTPFRNLKWLFLTYYLLYCLEIYMRDRGCYNLEHDRAIIKFFALVYGLQFFQNSWNFSQKIIKKIEKRKCYWLRQKKGSVTTIYKESSSRGFLFEWNWSKIGWEIGKLMLKTLVLKYELSKFFFYIFPSLTHRFQDNCIGK